MPSLHFDARNESDTAALGGALAAALPPGTTVGLYGTLGAGKTRLVQAVAEALGVEHRSVVSPTFVLIQEYAGHLSHAGFARPVYHIDAYRLASLDEFLDLGPDEYFESDGVVLIEWADRVEAALPPRRIDVRMEVTGDQSRHIEVIARGSGLDGVIEALRQWLAARPAA